MDLSVRKNGLVKSLWTCFYPWNYFQKTKNFILLNVFHVTFSRLLSCGPLQCSKACKSGTKIVWNNNGHGLLSILISFEGLKFSFFKRQCLGTIFQMSPNGFRKWLFTGTHLQRFLSVLTLCTGKLIWMLNMVLGQPSDMLIG